MMNQAMIPDCVANLLSSGYKKTYDAVHGACKKSGGCCSEVPEDMDELFSALESMIRPSPHFLPYSVQNGEGQFTVKADVPGVPKEEISLERNENGILRIKAGERRCEVRVLPDRYEVSKASAKLDLGVLTVTVPAHPAAVFSQIPVE